MNEVRPTNLVSPTVNKAASSKGPVTNGEESGKSLPEAQATNVTKVSDVEKLEQSKDVGQEQSKKEAVNVQDVVASMNEYVQSIDRDLQFTVDDETEKTVIKVLDGGSGELIRQIPEETFLELARKLNEHGEFQLINALG